MGAPACRALNTNIPAPHVMSILNGIQRAGPASPTLKGANWVNLANQ